MQKLATNFKLRDGLLEIKNEEVDIHHFKKYVKVETILRRKETENLKNGRSERSFKRNKERNSV